MMIWLFHWYKIDSKAENKQKLHLKIEVVQEKITMQAGGLETYF